MASVSEECLHLAVYTPKSPTETALLELPKEELLPIMFFVHGGGFTGGFQLQMDAARLGEVGHRYLQMLSFTFRFLYFAFKGVV